MKNDDFKEIAQVFGAWLLIAYPSSSNT